MVVTLYVPVAETTGQFDTLWEAVKHASDQMCNHRVGIAKVAIYDKDMTEVCSIKEYEPIRDNVKK